MGEQANPYRVARRLLANHGCGTRRRDQLATELSAVLQQRFGSADTAVTADTTLAWVWDAIAELPDVDRARESPFGCLRHRLPRPVTQGAGHIRSS